MVLAASLPGAVVLVAGWFHRWEQSPLAVQPKGAADA
jgi:hypothetical protein